MKQSVTIDRFIFKLMAYILPLFVYCPTYGQICMEESQTIIYKQDSTFIKYSEYIYRNESVDTIYLWIDSDVVYNDSLTFEQNNMLFFYYYIRRSKCELGLNFLCYDHSIYFGDVFPPPPVIGCTFIKKILPNESFTVFSLNETIGKESIHYVPQKIVSFFFRDNRLDDFCYKKKHIILQ